MEFIRGFKLLLIKNNVVSIRISKYWIKTRRKRINIRPIYPINKIDGLIRVSIVKVNRKIPKIFYRISQFQKLKARKNQYHSNHNPKLKIAHRNRTNLYLAQGQKRISMLDWNLWQNLKDNTFSISMSSWIKSKKYNRMNSL